MIEGIGPVLNKKVCQGPYVFHAMPSFPEGDILRTRISRGGGFHTKGHGNHIFAYIFPRNNIAANNNIDISERREMIDIMGEGFYNLVMRTKQGVQKIIRMGSQRRDGYLAVVDSAGFDEIFRYGNEGGANYFYVHQAVKLSEAKIVDVIPITGENSHCIFGFYHCNDFEYIPGLVGVVPLKVYLKECSSRMRNKLHQIANKIYLEEPMPLPSQLNCYVEANREKISY